MSLPANANSAAEPEPAQAEPGAPEALQTARPADLVAALKAQCSRLNEALAKEGTAKYSRLDLFLMYGQSSAASGRFDEAAAAYAMFLDENGTDHPYSEQVLSRLGASLAPVDLASVDVVHGITGPQYLPTWRMGQAASNEQLRLAVGVYKLLARTSKTPDEAGKALLALGWVHRALNDWNASTAAWDRAAVVGKDSATGADALWHAADNLAWTRQPTAAAARLRRLAVEHPDDPRGRAANDRIEVLEAEGRRTDQWFEDPVSSLKEEIAQRAGKRKPHEVYSTTIQWLQDLGKTAAIAPISRWATTQTDWPMEIRLSARLDLVEALLNEPSRGNEAKLEAAAALAEVVTLSPSDDRAVRAALRRARILSELGLFDAADKTIAGTESRWKNNPRWEPSVLTERIRSLVERGDVQMATTFREELGRAYPDCELPADLAAKLGAAGKGDAR